MTDWTDWKRWRGNCYEAAASYLQAHNTDPRGLVLCHGFPVLRAEDSEHYGKRYGHAWLETADGQTVIDLTIPASTRGLPKMLFYCLGGLGRIVMTPAGEVAFEEAAEARIVRYADLTVIFKAMLTSGHYGPWHDAPPGSIEDEEEQAKKKPKKRSRRKPDVTPAR